MNVDIFSDKSALVLDWLLTEGLEKTQFGVREIANSVKVSPALVYRILHQLEDQGLIDSDGTKTAKTFTLAKPEKLLEMWKQTYQLESKCKVWRYRLPFLKMNNIDAELEKLQIKKQICFALHSAMRIKNLRTSNLGTLEFYLLQPHLRSMIEKKLQLEPSEDVYDIAIIEPYYKTLVRRSLEAALSRDKTPVTTDLLTYLDLVSYPLRGQETAETLNILARYRSRTESLPSDTNFEEALKFFLQSLGPYREDILIGGGFALLIYQKYFSSQKKTPIGTTDLDVLLMRRQRSMDQTIYEQLIKHGFRHHFKDMSEPPTESYKFADTQGFVYEVEFLTDQKTRKDHEKNVKISGVVAQPLKYLDMSMQSGMIFKTKDGLAGKVVAPHIWMFHKGLTFVRRRPASSKFYKDLYGIWFLGSQLGDLSVKVVESLMKLRNEYPSRYKKFKLNLLSWIHAATPSDWRQLAMQDSHGDLSRQSFIKLIERIVG